MSDQKNNMDTYMRSAQQALERMGNNMPEHGLNQNGEPLRQIQNEMNEAVREVEVIDNSPPARKLGEGALTSMFMKGWDEAGHLTRAFHDADTVPVAPSYLEAQAPSPLQEYQQEMTIEPQPEQEMER